MQFAEQSGSTLADISEPIGEMQLETKQTVTLIGKTNDIIETQSKSVGETEWHSAIFNKQWKQTTRFNKVMDVMEAIINQEKIISINTQSIASISQETAAGTEEISSSIELQTASMQQSNHVARELETYSLEMKKQIDKSKL
ncbi:hypothetical protein [Virgibacillus oceani]|uniref:Methyl-accepting transducer domain-containing protein n=1 Tax=Virgibacillus oceani TaxID=1479511 RepID=A0A917H543_9BACI|nr:hypothetical protein [Virgibacillus oceani]GGG67683.1 hypothetical protein GCM10011398_09310 [Virgibacillus oceani]